MLNFSGFSIVPHFFVIIRQFP